MDYEYEDETERICFEFLDELRKSGITNMFGGGSSFRSSQGLRTRLKQDIY